MAKKSKADDDIIAEANAQVRARCLAFEADNRQARRERRFSEAGGQSLARRSCRKAARNRAPSVHHDQQIARVFAHGNERPATEQARHQGASGR
jgi:hypothetical protein